MFQEYVPCDSCVVICEVQTLERKIDEKFTSDMCKEEGRGEEVGGKSEPPATFLLALECIDTVRRFPVKFDVDGNTVVTCCSAENKVCGVQQEVMNQQLTLVGV